MNTGIQTQQNGAGDATGAGVPPPPPPPPKKVSALIRLALGDLERAEGAPGYVVDMDQWHDSSWGEEEECAVCLAGSVMAFSLRAPKDEDLVPSNFDPVWNAALKALDALRKGDCRSAGIFLGFPERLLGLVRNRVIPQYALSAADFKEAMEAMAAEYEAAGW